MSGERMNIIHLVRAVTWGGGERYALDLCGASVQAGHNVMVVTKGAPPIDSRFYETGAKLEKLPLGGVLDLISPLRLARMIRRMPGEEVVIHVHTFKDAEIAARAKAITGSRKRVRLVCTRHLVKRAKRSSRWRFIYRHIDALIFVSELAKRVFLEGNPSIFPERISVVHNSIIPPAVAHEPSCWPSSASADGILKPAPVCSGVGAAASLALLFTGRISPEKGIEPLIMSLHLLNDLPLTLRIAGAGSQKYISSLKTLAEKEGVASRVEWLGFVPDIYSEIRRADICVAPSVWREPFGLTIIEFMSQGKPVVTTDNGAQPEIITDGRDGLLVPPADPGALALAIRTLVQNPRLRDEMAANAARTFSSRFAYPVFFNKIMRIYKK